MLPRSIGSTTKTPERTGMIFDIQRYSLHDGPGIRTLVFFKGCPLGCLWCSNPEGQKDHPELMWMENHCIQCGKCMDICPLDAVSETEEGRKIIDRERCNYCGICTENCYADAMQLAGRYVSVDEILKEVEKDRLFYEESGGGITLGGGDPFFQPDFVRDLLKESKRRGLNTAVETSGSVPWERIEAAAGDIDLFLYDIKLMGPEKHIKFTGMSNTRILENAKRISERGGTILIRLTIVPGYTDSEDNIKRTAEFVKALKGAQGIELLAYHKLGEAKYRRLDMDHSLTGLHPPSDEEMDHLRQMAAGYLNGQICKKTGIILKCGYS